MSQHDPFSNVDFVAKSMLDAFKQKLIDDLTQIGIDAIKPSIREAAERTVNELGINANAMLSADPENYGRQVLVKLVMNEVKKA